LKNHNIQTGLKFAFYFTTYLSQNILET
jgi:hypothetical protein